MSTDCKGHQEVLFFTQDIVTDSISSEEVSVSCVDKMSFSTVSWKIENFSMCTHQVGEKLYSPKFTVPRVSHVEWNIELYPRGDADVIKGDYVSCYIRRTDQTESSDIKEFKLSIIVVNSNSNLSNKTIVNSFILEKNDCIGYEKIISHDKLYKDTKGFLPNGILTLQVEICPKFCENCPLTSSDSKTFLTNQNQSYLNFTTEESFSRDNQTKDMNLTHCTFLTRIPVERRLLYWKIEEFSANRKTKEKLSVKIQSEFHEGIQLLLVCYVEGSKDADENLRIDILRKGIDLRRTFLKCEVSFLDSSNDVVLSSIKSEHVFGETYTRWSFSLIEKISSSEDLIENDSLKLKFDFCISYDPQNVKHLTEGESSPQSDLQKEINKMLEYQETSDVSIECNSAKKFPVHKFLLCAKSPVFRAMFSNDILEKQTGVIRMQDTDTTTVQHLRDYLYSDHLPDLETEDILKLYPVADKYNIEKLKNKCAAFLKNNISTDNVSEIITVADMHNDNSLKDYANDFLIGEMDFDSDVWKAFTKENSALAAETMRKCLVKMKKA